MPVEVRKVEISGVQDASGMAALIDDGVFAADEVIGIIGKTEGNGGVNDFTRILADQAFRGVLADRGSRSMDEIKDIPWCGRAAATG
jgi:barbiturase